MKRQAETVTFGARAAYRQGMRIEVNLSVLQSNYNALRRGLTYAVVKADAYGHGLEQVASSLRADGFCVARAEEALRLRAVTRRPVLLLGYCDAAEAAGLMRRGITLSALDFTHFKMLERVAAATEQIGRVHLVVDTGMHRFGGDQAFVRAALEDAGNLRITGIYSHVPDPDRFAESLERFDAAAAGLPHAHLAATANLARCGYGSRVGLGLYGYGAAGVRPAMKVLARVVTVRDVAEGEWIGYGTAFRAPRRMRIAVADVGYGDGFFRVVNRGTMRIRDRELPVVGSVCMDVTFLDATDCETSVGDTVVVMDDAEAWAKLTDRIPYEYLTCWTPRAERNYIVTIPNSKETR